MRTKEEILTEARDATSERGFYIRVLEVLIDIRDELKKTNEPLVAGSGGIWTIPTTQCCACMGACNHTGEHSYCFNHRLNQGVR